VSFRPAAPEDFVVDEIPAYAPSGEGGHTLLRIEKRDCTTEEVARALARAADVAPSEIGYAGRKDRVAIARQWFSVPNLDPLRALHLALSRARVLEAARHPHKLRTGHLRGNSFEIALRDLGADTAARASARLAQIARDGMPNRYGEQRFGRDGDNAERAAALLAGRETVRDRRHARFLISALQAAVFNEVLAARPLAVGAIEAGDVAVVHASGGLFLVEDLAREAPRAADFEISATGPIFGTRVLEPTGAPLQRERAALVACGLDPDATLTPPRGVRLRGARRPLRVPVPDAAVDASEDGVLRLRFTLPAGSYATVLIEELLRPDDAAPAVGLS
jgi:tRNA pseudouridine13 synthase